MVQYNSRHVSKHVTLLNYNTNENLFISGSFFKNQRDLRENPKRPEKKREFGLSLNSTIETCRKSVKALTDQKSHMRWVK